MRYFILIFFLIYLLSAKETQDKEQEVTLGLGAYMQTQPYKGIDSFAVPSPVIFFDNGLFYVRWSRAGIYFLGDKEEKFSWGFSLTAQPRVFAYNPDDSHILEGMQEREATFEGGLAFSALYEKTYIEIMLLTDILDRYDSWLIKTEIGTEFRLNKFSFYPSLIVSYQSDEFVNYYYGVTQEESQESSFALYEPKSGFQVGAQTFIKYPLTDKLSILLNLRADTIPNSAKNSPIIEDTIIYSGLTSLIYTFKY
jgi:outer membrane protein